MAFKFLRKLSLPAVRGSTKVEESKRRTKKAQKGEEDEAYGSSVEATTATASHTQEDGERRTSVLSFAEKEVTKDASPRSQTENARAHQATPKIIITNNSLTQSTIRRFDAEADEDVPDEVPQAEEPKQVVTESQAIVSNSQIRLPNGSLENNKWVPEVADSPRSADSDCSSSMLSESDDSHLSPTDMETLLDKINKQRRNSRPFTGLSTDDKKTEAELNNLLSQQLKKSSASKPSKAHSKASKAHTELSASQSQPHPLSVSREQSRELLSGESSCEEDVAASVTSTSHDVPADLNKPTLFSNQLAGSQVPRGVMSSTGHVNTSSPNVNGLVQPDEEAKSVKRNKSSERKKNAPVSPRRYSTRVSSRVQRRTSTMERKSIIQRGAERKLVTQGMGIHYHTREPTHAAQMKRILTTKGRKLDLPEVDADFNAKKTLNTTLSNWVHKQVTNVITSNKTKHEHDVLNESSPPEPQVVKEAKKKTEKKKINSSMRSMDVFVLDAGRGKESQRHSLEASQATKVAENAEQPVSEQVVSCDNPKGEPKIEIKNLDPSQKMDYTSLHAHQKAVQAMQAQDRMEAMERYKAEKMMQKAKREQKKAKKQNPVQVTEDVAPRCSQQELASKRTTMKRRSETASAVGNLLGPGLTASCTWKPIDCYGELSQSGLYPINLGPAEKKEASQVVADAEAANLSLQPEHLTIRASRQTTPTSITPCPKAKTTVVSHQPIAVDPMELAMNKARQTGVVPHGQPTMPFPLQQLEVEEEISEASELESVQMSQVISESDNSLFDEFADRVGELRRVHHVNSPKNGARTEEGEEEEKVNVLLDSFSSMPAVEQLGLGGKKAKKNGGLDDSRANHFLQRL